MGQTVATHPREHVRLEHAHPQVVGLDHHLGIEEPLARDQVHLLENRSVQDLRRAVDVDRPEPGPQAPDHSVVGDRDELADRAYISGADFHLVAYTNTADSLSDTSVYADITEPASANGYAPILLDGTWSSTNGVITYVHSTPTHPSWAATGGWGATVTGVAIVYNSATLVHWKDLDVAFSAADGKRLEIDLDTVIS